MRNHHRMAKADLPPTRARRSWLEERLAAWIGRSGLPQPVREFRFAPPRLFRFDFAWPERGLALECEGGTFMRGRHSRGVGMRSDAEKYNLAILEGWYVARVTGDMVRDGSAFSFLQALLTTEIRYVPRVLVPERTNDGA